MISITHFDWSGLRMFPLAQASSLEREGFSFEQVWSDIFSNLGLSVVGLLKAILFLLIGWIVALIARSIVKSILNRTEIDNRIANWVSGDPENSPAIETWLAEGIFWLIMLFAIVAFLSVLGLEAVSEPLNSLLRQITGYIPQILGAVILLVIAWLIATLVKLLVSRTLGTFGLDERLSQPPEDPAGQPGVTEPIASTEPTTPVQNKLSLSETIANALYWFVFLLFLPSILSTLNLEGTLAPVQGLLDDILAILPNILAAVIIGAIGWVVAQIIRRVVTNFTAAFGVDRLGAKAGLTGGAGQKSLSWIVGTIVYVLVLIPVAIAALNALQIQAVTEPASAMLNQVLALLPRLFSATAVMIFAYIAGQYVSELVTNILAGFGFNRIYEWLGFASSTPVETPESTIYEGGTVPPSGTTGSSASNVRSPSELVGIIALVGIMLVAALTAVDILQIEALTGVVAVILAIAAQVLIAVIVFAVGLYLANLAANLIMSSGSRQSRILAQAARIAIIILVGAMALQQIGIAPNIVNLAFGLLLGAIAVAIAIAFGLGSKDIAAEQVREWLSSFKQE